MDRVGFLIEETGERLGCMLNPETLEISRISGVKQRRAAGGFLSGTGLKDDPLLFTGGGRTEFKMNLLFDVTVGGSSIQTEDVRDLTGPLWQLAENAPDDAGVARLRLARFVWGKAWNIPGVVAAIVERFEQFSDQGVPRRSWMSMCFIRVEDSAALSPRPAPAAAGAPAAMADDLPPSGFTPERMQAREIIGGSKAGEPGATGERLDDMANRAYGHPSYWRWLAAFNQVDDPLRLTTGNVIQIPSLERKRQL